MLLDNARCTLSMKLHVIHVARSGNPEMSTSDHLPNHTATQLSIA